jgi:hypothetical protein
MDDKLYFKIIDELVEQYGTVINPSIKNLKNVFKNGKIIDPQLPEINFAQILFLIWHNLFILNDKTLFEHFKETLLDINLTCIQGVSHRLLIDFVQLF